MDPEPVAEARSAGALQNLTSRPPRTLVPHAGIPGPPGPMAMPALRRAMQRPVFNVLLPQADY
jgi:hypothetical protein